MFPNTNGLIYSYRDFKPSEIHYKGFIPYDAMRRLDYIDVSKLEDNEVINFIDKYYRKFEEDIMEFNTRFGKYFFKEFCIKDYDHNGDDVYYRYKISDWDEEDRSRGIDSRILNADVYKYNPDSGVYTNETSYVFKTTHVYQIIRDVERKADFLRSRLNTGQSKGIDAVTTSILNLYVLPVYMRFGTHHQIINEDGTIDKTVVESGGVSNKKYHRISDIGYAYYSRSYLDNWDFDTTIRYLDEIKDILKAFAATNFYLLDMAENGNDITIYNYDTNRTSRKSFKSYVSKAKGDIGKEIKLSITESFVDKSKQRLYHINVYMNTEHDNTYVEPIPRKLCDYRFSVRGHYATYWCGSGPDKHKVLRWIDGYEKNKNKPYRIIKEFKE